MTTTQANLAAWLLEPKGDLQIRDAPTYAVQQDEILIKNQAISIQPFDAQIRREAYINVPYPFILGKTVAGTIVAVGPDVERFKIGDRVVSDTLLYKTHLTKNGAWQRYVVGNARWTVNIGDTPFEEAVSLPFPLQTAVGALHVYLGMEIPGDRPSTSVEEKILIWGAGGAVGGYAVQYSKSVGYTIVATASPRAAPHLKSIGASVVLDYKSPTVMDEIRSLGPYKFLFTTSGDPASQKALAELLQPQGGKFASTLGGKVELPSNVERIYEAFSSIAQKDGAVFESFSKWWYEEYFAKVIKEHIIEPAAFEKRAGGLQSIQQVADDILDGRAKAKQVLDPQE